MVKRIVVLLSTFVTLAVVTPQANAGMYQGHYAAFVAITHQFTLNKMHELNDKPNWHVTMNEEYISNAAEYDQYNGYIEWSFVAHGGDFTYRYYLNCLFTNRKIHCGGRAGGPAWHRDNWG
jgi:hypothetical protein